MPPNKPCNSTHEIQRMRLQLAVLSEIIEELSRLEDRDIRVSNECGPIPADQLLQHCRELRDVTRRRLVTTN